MLASLRRAAPRRSARRFCAPGAVVPTADLFVGNLPAHATVRDVRKAFEKACSRMRIPVRSVNFDVKTEDGKTYTTVSVDDFASDAVRRCMDRSTIAGATVSVGLEPPSHAASHEAAAAPREERPEEPGDREIAERKAATALLVNEDIIECEAAVDVLKIFENDGGHFNAVNLAAAIHRIGVHHRAFHQSQTKSLRDLFNAAVDSMAEDAQDWHPRQLWTTAWGLAKLGRVKAKLGNVRYSPSFDAVAAAALPKLRLFNSQELAGLVWAFSRAGEFETHKKLFDAVAALAPDKMGSFTGQNLAHISWAFATSGFEAPKLFQAVAAEALHKVPDLDPQSLANLSWAFATAGSATPGLFKALAAQGVKQMATLDADELERMVWAFKNTVEAPQFFEFAASEATNKIRQFQPHTMAKILSSFATASDAHVRDLVVFKGLYLAAAQEVVKKVALYDGRDLAQTAWAFTMADFEAPVLFEALAAEAVKKIESFRPQALAQIVWSYASLQVRAPLLFEAVEVASYAKMTDFSAEDLAATVWAFTTSQVQAPGLFLDMALESTKKISTFSPQQLSNTAWAYSTCGAAQANRRLLEAVAQEAMKKLDKFTAEELSVLEWVCSKEIVGGPLFDAIAKVRLK